MHVFEVGELSHDEHATTTVFAPKTEEEQLDFEIASKVADVRALSMENCSLKAISTAVNDSLKWHLLDRACEAQHGCIPGRRFADNCLILDTKAWEYGLSSTLPVPTLFFLDFKAAFPS
eukprot:5557131-Karenia_brevis.AAC.1